jgi:hypothetical protein
MGYLPEQLKQVFDLEGPPTTESPTPVILPRENPPKEKEWPKKAEKEKPPPGPGEEPPTKLPDWMS